MSSGKYDGAILTQGSPAVEETAYWFNLLIDTTRADLRQRRAAAARPDQQRRAAEHRRFARPTSGRASGPTSKGRNRAGVVVIQEQRVFAAREVAKVDARPGGYVATGGHGGILGGINHIGMPELLYVPAYKHTYLSEVNTSRLPNTVKAVRAGPNGARNASRSRSRERAATSCRRDSVVSIVKDGGYCGEEFGDDPALEPDLAFLIEHKLGLGRLAGFVTEGQVPYGAMTSRARQKTMEKAV